MIYNIFKRVSTHDFTQLNGSTHKSFVCTHFNVFQVLLCIITIQLNIGHVLTHS